MKKSIIITILFLCSGVLGFCCQVLYAKYFGAYEDMDINFAILSLPSIVTGIVPIIFTSLFLPTFTNYSQNELRSYISQIFKHIMGFGVVFSVLGLALSILNIDSIIAISADSMRTLAVILCILYWLNSFFAIINGFLACIHNYYKHFIIVAVVPLLTYVGILLSIVTLHGCLGVKSIALGMVVSSVVQVMIYKKNIYNRSYRKHVIKIEYKVLLKQICFIIVSLLPFTAFGAIAYFWAGHLSAGSVSYLGYSHSFSGFLSIATSMGVAVVSFPDLANNLNTTDSRKIAETLCAFEKSLMSVIILTLTIVSFVIQFIGPILDILLNHGRFDQNSVKSLAAVLPFYFVGGLCLAILNLLRNVFYSMKKYRDFALISGIVTLLFFLCAVFMPTGITYVGIGVIENSFLFLFAVTSILFLHFKSNEFARFDFIIRIIKFIVISVISAFIAKLIYDFSKPINDLVAIVICGMIYMVLIVYMSIHLIKIEEIKIYYNYLCVKNKWKKYQQK